MISKARVAKWISRIVLLILILPMTFSAGCWDGNPDSCPVGPDEVESTVSSLATDTSTDLSATTSTAAPTVPQDPADTGEIIFAVNNDLAVENGGTNPKWTVTTPMLVTKIQTYHWNDGKGGNPYGLIGLKPTDGSFFHEAWATFQMSGQGGVPNAYQIAYPNIVVPPGTYYVVDEDLATWSQNAESGGVGFVIIWGKPAG